MAETSEHLSDAQLAVLASSGGDDAQVEHLAACEACRERVANTVRAIRALADPVEIVAPPAGLWERVEDSLRGEGVGGAPGRPGVRERQTGSSRRRPRPRRSSWAVAVAGVLAGALAGGTGVAVATHLRDAPQDEARITAVTVGTADLQPVTATAMHGHAVMQREPDDRLELRVDVSELPEDGYLEVWLRDEQASRLISLGILDSQVTAVQVPAGVDLTRYPVVDVSREHFDGDPSHGGETLVAGAMEPATG